VKKLITGRLAVWNDVFAAPGHTDQEAPAGEPTAMYIRVLSFHLTNNDDRDEAAYFCERAVLGLAEFDGYISDTCLTQPESGIFGGMIAWHDWKSLEGVPALGALREAHALSALRRRE
jgi:hypothetical protein